MENLKDDNIVKISFMDIELYFDKSISFCNLPTILQYLTEIYSSSKIDSSLKAKIKNVLENYQIDTEVVAHYLESIYNKFIV